MKRQSTLLTLAGIGLVAFGTAAAAQSSRPTPPTPPTASVAPAAPTPPVAPFPATAPVAPVAPIPAPPGLAPLPPLPPLPAFPGLPPAAYPNNPELLQQRETRTKEIDRTFPVNGRAVHVDGHAMHLTVELADTDQATLSIELEYWSNNEEWMDLVEDEFDVDIDERSLAVEISGARMPERDESWWRRVFGSNREVSWAMDAVLRVPAGTELRLENRYGDIDVARIGGSLTIDNASGEVTVSGSGETSINNSYGPVTVRGTGPLRVRGTSSAVNVADVEGDADLETSYDMLVVENVRGDLEAIASSGGVRVSGVTGTADVTNSYAQAEIQAVGSLVFRGSSSAVEVRGVRGAADLETSYDSMAVEDVDGNVDIINSSGAVTVSNTRGDVSVNNSYAPVRLSGIAGRVRVDSSSSGVQLSDVGEARVETSYAGVEIRGVSGTVEIRNQSGRIDISGLRGEALSATHDLRTSYADIEVEWPAGTPLAMEAEATYGRIRSDFPGQLEERSSRQRFTADATGGGRLNLVAANGSIAVRER